MRLPHGFPVLPALASVLWGVALAAPPAAADFISPPLRAAVRDELPRDLAEVAGDAPLFSGPAGTFQVFPANLDGTEPVECVLTWQAPGRPARIVFFGLSGDKLVRKEVKLPGGAPESLPDVNVPLYSETARLALVKHPDTGSVLLAWNGKSVEQVWDSGKPRKGETVWFQLDDLDGDGIREIVTYQKLLLDIALDDELGEAGAGAATEQVGPTEVLRYEDGKWKQDKKLLDGLR